MDPPKAPMSETERLELVTKLDRELDEFMSTLPKRVPEEPVPFDRWEEDLVNHPFFMKELPAEGAEVHPLLEGLQKLKYDPDYNEPEDLAQSYKDDGNFNFKYKKYRMAVISYTEGIKANCDNAELVATLYNNRAAAHFHLKNYRSALLDCQQALKRQSGYKKAMKRAALSCFHTSHYEKALEYCDLFLESEKNDSETLELRKKTLNEIKIQERNKRKQEITQKRMKSEENALVGAILKRGIYFEGGRDSLTLTKLEPQFPELFNSRVHLNEEEFLVWPVILFYPEYKIMDYIQKFDERNCFQDELALVFAEFPEWDTEKKYKPENLNVYYEDINRKNIKIDVNQTLSEILQSKGLVLKEGTPRFVVLERDSRVESCFLAK